MKIRSAVHIFFAGTLFLAAAGCSAPKITNTPRNAIEQLLVAAVIERGVYGIQLDKYRDKKFFLNYDNLAPQVDKPYLQGCVELHCAASGITVVKEQEQPDGKFPTCPYPNPEIKEARSCSAPRNCRSRFRTPPSRWRSPKSRCSR